MMRTVSILGVGWLGLPLAKKLKSSGYHVKGSVTTKSKMEMLQQAAIWPYHLELSPDGMSIDDERFFEADVLIVLIPPRRIAGIETVFPAQMRHLIEKLERVSLDKVIFISSTSVYPENGLHVRETDLLIPEKPSGQALLQVEHELLTNSNFQTTVVRFGGLIGADRNPARFLSRKKTAVPGSKPVNLIHQDDCIAILMEIIRQNAWGEIFNACCPKHPTRKAFYTKASAMSGIEAPQFTDEEEPYKLVDSSKLIQYLDYSFKYPSPMDYLRMSF